MSNSVIVAKREYYLLGSSEHYRVEIYAPHLPLDSNGNWRCAIKIHGRDVPDGLEAIESGGSDSYQALILAFKMVKAMVESLNKHLNARLRFHDDTDTNLFLD